MRILRRFGAALLALPLALAPLACGGDDERAALDDEELDRELDMALKGDSAPATFQDTTVGAEAAPAGPEAVAPAPAAPRPQAAAPRTQAAAPRTQTRTPAPQPAARPATRSVPSGTTFAVTLNETLSTETNTPGDAFSAALDEPIIAGDGTTIVPAGAQVRGRVTRVEKSDRVGETAVITVAFESISFGGRSYPIQATVLDANPERRTRTTTKQSAGKVAAGAAAGAILGKVLGKDPVKGAVVGAAAGTAIAMGTADVDAVLASGSRMVIRLDAPIEVRPVSY